MKKSKVFIFVKENDSVGPPQFMLDKIRNGEIKENDIMVALDKTCDDLRPMVKGAEFEVLYENA